MVAGGHKKLSDILSQVWWNHHRFAFLGEQLKIAYDKTPKIMEDVRENFRNHKDKLSYFEFFNHLEFDCKLKFKNWQLDSIESRLDKLGLAYIDWQEYLEFCIDWDIDFFGEQPDKALDTEAIMQERLNVSYKDYKLTKADYFNQEGKTILNSEKAALAKCNQIWEYWHEKTNQDTNWLDKDFGPLRKSDLDRCKRTLYKTGEPPKKGYSDPREVEFVFQ
jgi:hypothetical protein